MTTEETESHGALVLPNGIRRLALAAACVSGIVGILHLGLIFLPFPLVLILGTVVQPKWHRPGKRLIAMGAWILTFNVGGFLGVPAVITIRRLRLHHELGDLLFLSLCLISVFLVAWSDVALLINAWEFRKTSYPLARSVSIGDWLAWAVAASLTILVPYDTRDGIYVLQHGRRWDIFLPGALFALVIVLFDVVLIADAARMYQNGRLRERRDRSASG
ncbi:MAG TPA: hypothetical protein VFW94_18560 [Candidatus Acidoferrales bacterium]|nr:hypothetical protein [Candidatus Acidoferrales bacterium]